MRKKSDATDEGKDERYILNTHSRGGQFIENLPVE